MKNGQKFIACILCLVLTFSLSSCIGDADEEKKDSQKTAASAENERQSNLDVILPTAYSNVDGLDLEPGSYISLIGRSSSGEFWEMIQAGAQQAVDDINTALGYTGDDKIKVTFSGPGEKDNVNEQVNILDQELDLYPVALGIAIVDSTACEVQFDLAAENNIPIVAFESGSEYENLEAMVATNNTEAMQTAAAKLCQAIDEEGEILLFVHDSTSTVAVEQEESFLNEIKSNHPNVTVTGVYHMDQLDEIKEQIAAERNAQNEANAGGAEADTDNVPPADTGIKAEDITDQEVLDYILEQHPDVKGCVTSDADTTQTVLAAIKSAAGNEIEIIGFNGGSNQLASLKNESLTGLIVQNPYGMGYATVIAAARAALGLGNEATVDCGYIWVTKDNMETEYIKKLLY